MEQKTHAIIMELPRPDIEQRVKQLLTKFVSQRHLKGRMRQFHHRSDGVVACELDLPAGLGNVHGLVRQYFSNSGIVGMIVDAADYSAKRCHIKPGTRFLQPQRSAVEQVRDQDQRAEEAPENQSAQIPVQSNINATSTYALAKLEGRVAGREFALGEQLIQSKDEELADLRRTLRQINKINTKKQDAIHDPLHSLIHAHIGRTMDTYHGMLKDIFAVYALLQNDNPMTIPKQFNDLTSLAQYINDRIGAKFTTDRELETWLRNYESTKTSKTENIEDFQREFNTCRKNKSAYENAVAGGASESMLAAMKPFADDKRINELETAINSCLDAEHRQKLYTRILESKREYDEKTRLRDDAKARHELGCTFPIVIEYAKGRSPGLSVYLPNVTGDIEMLHKSFAKILEQRAMDITGYEHTTTITPFGHVALKITLSSEWNAGLYHTVVNSYRRSHSEDLDALGAKIDIAYLEHSQ